jgi:hypothetical protein
MQLVTEREEGRRVGRVGRERGDRAPSLSLSLAPPLSPHAQWFPGKCVATLASSAA